MPRLVNAVPRYRRHKQSGQAIVTLNGRDYLLGPWRSKASKIKYDRLIAEWLARNRQPIIPEPDLTVAELSARYWAYSKKKHVRNGKPTAEQFKVKTTLQHLLKLCALFGTLLSDQDGVYDSTDSSDRLLLSLKGTMSEFELFTMRNRRERGRLHKAERGKLFFTVPMGYVLLPSGKIVKKPDEQARAVTRLMFDKFAEIGTAYGVLHYLVDKSVEFGI